MSVTCPKCSEENVDAARFCRRCHMTISFVCPACRAVQRHGGTCDACGVDFLKYGMIQMDRLKATLEKERGQITKQTSVAKEIMLAVATGGFSLLRLLYRRVKR